MQWPFGMGIVITFNSKWVNNVPMIKLPLQEEPHTQDNIIMQKANDQVDCEM